MGYGRVFERFPALTRVVCCFVGHVLGYCLEFEKGSDEYEPIYVRCCLRCGSRILGRTRNIN